MDYPKFVHTDAADPNLGELAQSPEEEKAILKKAGLKSDPWIPKPAPADPEA